MGRTDRAECEWGEFLMANYLTNDTDLGAVADAIRTKGGTSADLVFPQGFVDAIDAIETGGGCVDALIDRSITSIKSDALAVGMYAFNQCNKLTTALFPHATRIGAYAFSVCSSLADISFPSVTNISTYAFNTCKFVNFFLPELVTMNDVSVLISCNSLVNFVAPKLGVMGYRSISACSALKRVDLTSVTRINGDICYNCHVFDTLIIRSLTVPTLAYVSAFTGTPFASNGSGGTLYVPSALISSYESATNWSTILGYTNNQILPIEGSIYETQYADGTPIPTT